MQCPGAIGNAFPIRKPTLAVPQQSKEPLLLRGGQGNAPDLDQQLSGGQDELQNFTSVVASALLRPPMKLPNI